MFIPSGSVVRLVPWISLKGIVVGMFRSTILSIIQPIVGVYFPVPTETSWFVLLQFSPTFTHPKILILVGYWNWYKKSHFSSKWKYTYFILLSTALFRQFVLVNEVLQCLVRNHNHQEIGFFVLSKCHLNWSKLLFQFYQRNGQPYPICDTDRLVVEVSECEGHRRVATLVELGGTEPHSANTAVVKFTVRQAGQYKIAILIGNTHINGSPFFKQFLPGKYWYEISSI